MAPREVNINDVPNMVGEVLGSSDWHLVTQDDIKKFAARSWSKSYFSSATHISSSDFVAENISFRLLCFSRWAILPISESQVRS